MQTETQSGPFPVQDFPAHLLEIPEVASDSTAELPPALASSLKVPPDSIGAIRGAIFCLPIAVVMWAIIIAAVLHFLIA